MATKDEDTLEKIEQALEDLEGYIDGNFSSGIHYGVPPETAAQYAKHMHSVVIRLRRLIK